MGVKTYLTFVTEDAQGYEELVKFRIKDSAFGTGIPTAAKIEAVATALFGGAILSTQKVLRYNIMVEEDAPADPGGDGSVATATAVRFRNAIGTLDWPFSIPGLNKSAVVFDPTNPNSISTAGAMMDAIRAALVDAAIAVSDPKGAYGAIASADLMQVATAFQGRRAPKRVR